MIARHSPFRNLLLLACAAVASFGCGAQLFLRMEPRAFDGQVRLFLGGGGNSLAFFDGPEVLLVDTKLAGMARQLRVDLEDRPVRQVRRLLLTHSHLDHTAGVGLYTHVGAVLVHPRTRGRLEADGVRARFVEVEDEVLLQLGGERVRVKYLGRAHTDGDLVALFEHRRLLVAGDLVMKGFEPTTDLNAGGSILEFRPTLDALLALDFVTVLPGHGEPMSRAEVEHVRGYLVALEAAVRAARARGLDEAQAVREVSLPEFDDLRPVPFAANRENSVRLMFHALEAAMCDAEGERLPRLRSPCPEPSRSLRPSSPPTSGGSPTR